MKFTSEDLMKAMGLQVGDRVRVFDKGMIATFEVTNDYGLFRVDCVDIPNARTGYELHHILDLDFEILLRPKRVGDLKCGSFECKDCPVRAICNFNNIEDNLYKELETYKEHCIENDTFDQEIYDLLKARLNKVVE